MRLDEVLTPTVTNGRHDLATGARWCVCVYCGTYVLYMNRHWNMLAGGSSVPLIGLIAQSIILIWDNKICDGADD